MRRSAGSTPRFVKGSVDWLVLLLVFWRCSLAPVRAADLPADLLPGDNARPGLCVVLEPADAASLVALRGNGRFVV